MAIILSSSAKAHFDDVFSLAKRYPQIYASVGVHPCELKGKDPSVAELLALAEDDNIIAIGETGLDYFHVEKDTADWQRERFRRHTASPKKTHHQSVLNQYKRTKIPPPTRS
jgi:TatD DNase family protein